MNFSPDAANELRDSLRDSRARLDALRGFL